ncbi:MAG: SDR family NAD(P)-dependent oxidoreductase, partial [Zoogloea sp.]|nr:SDR family NAD(P)-dependent oxidoreductase [Zoogloea sp.]
MAGRVQDKVALVTGGASGLGRATVELLAREGAQVIITDIAEEAGQALAEEIGSSALFLRHDAASEADWKRVMGEVQARFGRLDILVNNAGILIKGSIEEASLDDWQRLMRINADSVFLGCREGVALMKAGGGGSIV